MNSKIMSSLLLLLLLAAGQQRLSNAIKMGKCHVNLFRLPMRARPSNYNLDLSLDPEKEFFQGSVEIDLKIHDMDSVAFLLSRTNGEELPPLVHDPRNIILNMENLEVTDVAFYGDNGSLDIDSMCQDESSKILVVTLAKIPTLINNAKLAFKFNGKLQEEAKGLFRSHIHSSQVLLTYLKPAYARRLFPCFDEPEFKATFKLTIKHPPGTIALTNVQMIEQDRPKDAFVFSYFKPTAKISSYLLSLAVGQFEPIAQTSKRDGKRITIYAPKGHSKHALDMITKARNAYDQVSDFFAGLPQPLEKIDIVALDTEPSGIDNWGLITMSWSFLSAGKTLTKFDEWNHAAVIIIGKLVRQRVANLLTVRWWDDLWLTEGLATYFASKLAEKLHPEDGHKMFSLIDTTVISMNNEDYPQNAKPVKNTDLKTVEEFIAWYDSLVYKKSAAVLRMFGRLFSEEMFKSSIRELIRWSPDGLLSADLWWERLSRFAPQHGNMIEMAKEWIEQAGYPTISVSIKEERFLILRQRKELANNRIWSVPICFKVQSSGNFYSQDLTLHGTEASIIKLPPWYKLAGRENPQWFTVNCDYEGYYRVLYESSALLKQQTLAAAYGRMAPADRLQLIGDAHAYAKRGNLLDDFEKFLKFFENETNDGLIWLLTRILMELHGKNRSVCRSEIVKRMMLNYYEINGHIWKEAGSNVLKQNTRGMVLEYLVKVLANPVAIDEARTYMRVSGGAAPSFLKHVLNNLPPKG